MLRFNDICDDFYVNVNLNTDMDMPCNRESVLHFFEQLQKKYTGMKNFYCREPGEFVLEEDKEKGYYRWASVETRRICSGYVNPPSYEEALEQHWSVLESLPYSLSASPLDCESINFMYGFDFTYRGNHNDLLAEALGLMPAYEKILKLEGTKLLGQDPWIQFAVDPECRFQCRISFETRTTALHVKTGEFPEEQLSVYLTMRRYGSLQPGETFVSTCQKLREHAERITQEYVVDNVLKPLQEAIAIK